MFNKNFMLFLAGIAGLAVKASPVSNENLTIMSTEETEFGTVTVWGVPDSVPTKSDNSVVSLEKRQCGSVRVFCSEDFAANTISCNSLINFIELHGGTVLPSAPRSVCLTQSGDQCCVSWANPIGGLVEGNLVYAARPTLNSCKTGSGRVSGFVRNVNLQGVCTTQCLSNRPNGCTN